MQEKEISLTLVTATELSEQDLVWLIKACATSYIGTTALEVLQKPQFFLLLRVSGGAEGIIILQKLRHPTGLEIELWALAGRKLVLPLANARIILHKLKALAKLEGAKWFGSTNRHPALDRFYQRIATKYATKYLMEI